MAKRILITTDKIGRDNGELGAKLMKNFLYTVARNDRAPKSVTFWNEGVRLACEGSESLDDLRMLVDRGVIVKACGTCLEFLGLADRLAVGIIGTMPECVPILLSDEDILTIA